jgi:hypothetical protein
MLTIAMTAQTTKTSTAGPPYWAWVRIAVARTPRLIDPRAMTGIATLRRPTDPEPGRAPGA